LCRRYPTLKACLAYREAIAEFKRITRRSTVDVRDHDWWKKLPATVFRSQVARALERTDHSLESVPNREATGFDFVLGGEGHRVLIRCEEGSGVIEAGVGRELSACLAETGADRAILMTTGKPSAALTSYLMGRPVKLVRPWEILAQTTHD
jgi:hypothetical protein